MRGCSLKIFGRVQGVYYRQSTREKALEFNINGTVRNCDDGSVEIVAEGIDGDMQKFIEWCNRGPAGAKVERIDINDEPLKNLRGFIITH